MRTAIKNLCLILLLNIISLGEIDAQNYHEWYLQSEDKASQLFVREIGTGPAVVVLHGGPGMPHDYLLGIADGLTNSFRFVFYDQRGSRSSPIYSDSATIEKHVEDLETIRKTFNIDKMNIVAHSAGTHLFYNYLLKYPDKVKNVVLIGAVDPKNGKRSYFTDKEYASFSNVSEEREAFNQREELQDKIKDLGLNKPVLSKKQEFDLRALKSAASNIYNLDNWQKCKFFFANASAARTTMRSINFTYNYTSLLANHKHKITVINGFYDFVVGGKGSPIWSSVVENESSNVKLIILEEAGHNAWIDQPDQFKRSMLNGLMDN